MDKQIKTHYYTYYEFIFYKFYKLFSLMSAKDNPEIKAMSFVSGLILLNIIPFVWGFTILDLLPILKGNYLTASAVITIGLIFFVNDRYFIKSKMYETILEKYKKENVVVGFNRKIGNIIVFVFCTFFLFSAIIFTLFL